MLTNLISCTEGDAEQQTSKAKTEKSQRQKLSESALQGLREEYMDTPMEIAEYSANGGKMKIAKERQERLELVTFLLNTSSSKN